MVIKELTRPFGIVTAGPYSGIAGPYLEFVPDFVVGYRVDIR